MSNPILTGAVLIEANGAALNNAGNAVGQRLDNAVVVKQIKIGRRLYPYVSGQAWRRWWREVATEDFGWTPSPVTREAKSAYTDGNPQEFPDDDIFGYMAAKKATKKAAGKKGKDAKAEETGESQSLFGEAEGANDADVLEAASEEDSEDGEATGGTQRRVSPLKNSLLVAVVPNTITSDFGHFSRSLPVDNPNMVPFEHEHYSTPLQGVFTLSLSDVGRFECGPMRDVDIKTAPSNGAAVAQEASGNLKPRVLQMPLETRRERATQTLRCLKSLRHGANLTRNLSDVTPSVVLLGFLDGGNAPFQNLFVPANGEARESVALHLPRLESVLTDYAARLLGKNKKLFFGYRPGVLANETEVLAKLKEGIAGISFEIGTPLQAIEAAAAVLESDGILN